MLPAAILDSPESGTNINDNEGPTNEPAAALDMPTSINNSTVEANVVEGEQEKKRSREGPWKDLAMNDSAKPAKRLRSSSDLVAKTKAAPPVIVTDDKLETVASPKRPQSASRAEIIKHEGDVVMTSPLSNNKRLCTRQERWKVHQMAEDFVELASNMMLIPTSHLGPYGYDDKNSTIQGNHGGGGDASSKQQPRKYPMELISALGFLKSPLRRPTVMEKWSPYEISLFEAGMGHYGKDFYEISKIIQTKSTKEVIDFYYIWKKTSHYKVWKKSYIPPIELLSDDEQASASVMKPKTPK